MALRLASSCLLLVGMLAVVACNAITGASDLDTSGSSSGALADGGPSADAADNGGDDGKDGGVIVT